MGALFAFTGVDVPLGIALMAAGAVGMVTAIGLNWDSMSDPLRRTIGMLETIVGGALLTFGAILALTGVNVPLGVAMIAAGAVSVASAVALNWNSLTGDVQESVLSIVAIVSGAFNRCRCNPRSDRSCNRAGYCDDCRWCCRSCRNGRFELE